MDMAEEPDASADPTEDLGEDILRKFFRAALDRLKNGDLYTEAGLTESDVILGPHEYPPEKTEKSHKYNKLMDVVAKDIAAEYSMDKKGKKYVAKLLRNYNQEWATLCRDSQPKKDIDDDEVVKNTESIHKQEEAAPNPDPAEADESAAAPAVKNEDVTPPTDESAVEANTAVATEDNNNDGPHYTEAALKRKAEFEKNKRELLSTIPDSVKERYGQIYFAKWGNRYLPILVLGPYSMPPGAVREMFFDMYHKVKATDRLHQMSNCVYWYGAYDDLPNAFSFLTTNKLIKHDVGLKKKHGKIPPAITKKLEQGKKLSAADEMFVNGMEEMKKDLPKEPSERRGYLKPFPEDWEFEDEDDMEEDAVEEKVLKPKKQKAAKGKKLKKRKKDDGAADGDEATPKKKAKKGVKKKVVEKKEPDAFKVGNIEDFADDDLSSHEDKDDGDLSIPSDSDQDDEDFDYGKDIKKPKEPKKKKETKVSPKKKAKKMKLATKRQDSPKKDSKLEKITKLEQKRFTDCEEKYLEYIDRWKTALLKKSQGAIKESYKELLKYVDKFSAPFIEAYEMPKLMKQSKKIVDNESRSELWKTMKKVYIEKNERVPNGFVPEKRAVAGEVQSTVEEKLDKKTAAKPAAVASEEVSKGEAEKAASAPTTPKKPVSESQESFQLKLPAPVVSERKKKFSLGSYMTKPNPNAQKQASSRPGVSRSSSSNQLSRRQDNPSWISQATSLDTPSDENRSFALDFLQQASPFIPANDDVNHEAIARELEAAIYRKFPTSKDLLSKYWEKVDDIVAAISGDRGAGTIAKMISLGRFRSADDVVGLSENDIVCSFEGKPLADYERSF